MRGHVLLCLLERIENWRYQRMHTRDRSSKPGLGQGFHHLKCTVSDWLASARTSRKHMARADVSRYAQNTCPLHDWERFQRRGCSVNFAGESGIWRIGKLGLRAVTGARCICRRTLLCLCCGCQLYLVHIFIDQGTGDVIYDDFEYCIRIAGN